MSMTEQMTRAAWSRHDTQPPRLELSVRQPVPFVTAGMPNGRTHRGASPTPTGRGLGEGTALRVSLRRLWTEALADEARHVAPFERMATALLVFASGVTLLVAFGAASRLVVGWDALVAFVQRLIF